MASSLPITTALIRQVDASSAIQFSSDNITWTNISTWPFTIGNSNSNTTILKVKFTTNIYLSNISKTDYFILNSSNIIIDGDNKIITVNDIKNFPGLIKNGSSSSNADGNGNNNITIKNISIGITGTTTLLPGQGWICKNYFGKGSSGNVIQNCSSSGPIPTNSGGVAGQYTAINSTGFIISGCSATGSILDGAAGANAGGIIGANSGSYSTSFTITTCTYSGDINGNGSGGIIGASSTNFSITFCSSSGIIKGGGIAGDYTGIVSPAINVVHTGIVSISDCFSKGDIGSSVGTSGATSAGGIIGAYGRDVTITRCYSIGAIGGEGKNSCGGIVGNYGGVSGGAVVVQSCFTTSNIYKDCGGIVGSYFGYNVSKGCNVYDCYSLGDIGDGAGGIAGPEFGAGHTICRISRCYSLGVLTTIASGGIIAPSTVTYPTTTVVSQTVDITRCFNTFNIGSVENSIVGLGVGISVVGKTKSTFPKRQGTGVTYDNTISSVTYGTTNNNTSLGTVAENLTSVLSTSQWYRLKSSSGAKPILRLKNGYYKITQDILGTAPFSKLDLLGFTVSEFILGCNYNIDDLISQKINIVSTVAEFNKANISLNDLFTANVSLSTIQKIGYTIDQVNALRPNTTITEFIDAGYNYKTQGFTITGMLNIQSTLTPLEFSKAGFSSKDLRTSERFTLLKMKQSGLTVSFLRGTYKDLELYNVGFNARDFRLGGYYASTLLFELKFKPEEFASSGYSVYSLTSGMSRSIIDSTGSITIENRPLSDEMLIAIGYPRSEILLSQQINYNFGSDPQMKTYAFYNATASEIPKHAIITNIKNYPSPMFGAYKPADFITAAWTKSQVGKMGFTARSLLDSDYFDLRDLKTLNYSNGDILDSGHSTATSSAVNAAEIYKTQPPPLITTVITSEEGQIYIYIRQIYTNASADITGYAVSFNGEDYNLLEVANPLIVKGLTFEEDIYVYIKSYNGEFSIDNYMSLAKKIKPRTLTSKQKPNWLKIGVGIALVVTAGALVAVTGGAALMAAPNEFKGFVAGSLAIGVAAIVTGSLERNYNWKEGDFSINPNFINKIPKFLKNILPINEIDKYYKTYLLGSSLLVKSDENEIFLKTTTTITSIYAFDGNATVNFTYTVKYNETIVGISYSTDNGTTWIQTTTTTSPLQINGLSKNSSVTICIRALSVKNSGNTTSGTIVNYLYSQPTASGSSTNLINVCKWGEVSNTVTANMIITPYPPRIYHVFRNKNSNSVTVYFTQLSNGGGGFIKDYEYSLNGKTWTPADLNLTGEKKKTGDWVYETNGELSDIFQDITITGLKKASSCSIALKSKTSDGIIGNNSNTMKSSSDNFSKFIMSKGAMFKAS